MFDLREQIQIAPEEKDWVTVRCAVCEADDPQLLLVNWKDPMLRLIVPLPPFGIRWMICRCCGLVYQNPRLARERLEELYRAKYRDARGVSPEEYHGGAALSHAQSQVKWLKETVGPGLWSRPGQVLDIGCATGPLLDLFRADGWQTFGVEPTVEFARYAREVRGHEVLASAFVRSCFLEDQFDLITISHVLEHVVDPIEFLSTVRNKLREDGRLFVEVPDIQNPLPMLWESFFAVYHLYLFSQHTLALVLRRTGFVPEAVSLCDRGVRLVAVKCRSGQCIDPAQEGNSWYQIAQSLKRYRRFRYPLVYVRVHIPIKLKQVVKSSLFSLFGPSFGGWLHRRLRRARNGLRRNDTSSQERRVQ